MATDISLEELEEEIEVTWEDAVKEANDHHKGVSNASLEFLDQFLDGSLRSERQIPDENLHFFMRTQALKPNIYANHPRTVVYLAEACRERGIKLEDYIDAWIHLNEARCAEAGLHDLQQGRESLLRKLERNEVSKKEGLDELREVLLGMSDNTFWYYIRQAVYDSTIQLKYVYHLLSELAQAREDKPYDYRELTYRLQDRHTA